MVYLYILIFIIECIYSVIMHFIFNIECNLYNMLCILYKYFIYCICMFIYPCIYNILCGIIYRHWMDGQTEGWIALSGVELDL